MRRIILLGAAIASTVAAADQQTFTGTITDTTCGKSHGMVAGQPHEKCLAMCVIGPSGQYALFDGETGPKKLSDQKSPAKYAAQRAKLNGTPDEKSQTIKVDSIEPEEFQMNDKFNHHCCACSFCSRAR